MAARWADEVADVVRAYGGGNSRLAVDRINPERVAALSALDIEVVPGELMEHARTIKSPDELSAVCRAIAA